MGTGGVLGEFWISNVLAELESLRNRFFLSLVLDNAELEVTGVSNGEEDVAMDLGMACFPYSRDSMGGLVVGLVMGLVIELVTGLSMGFGEVKARSCLHLLRNPRYAFSLIRFNTSFRAFRSIEGQWISFPSLCSSMICLINFSDKFIWLGA